jgi:hypothetical protein
MEAMPFCSKGLSLRLHTARTCKWRNSAQFNQSSHSSSSTPSSSSPGAASLVFCHEQQHDHFRHYNVACSAGYLGREDFVSPRGTISSDSYPSACTEVGHGLNASCCTG